MNRDEVELLLADLVAATTPAGLGTNPVSLFPRDLGISNMVSQLTLGYLQQELISGNFVDLNTVSLLSWDVFLSKTLARLHTRPTNCKGSN